MDLRKYTFWVRQCSSKLDKIEARLGVKFDRKALFDHEQSLCDRSTPESRLFNVRWTFKISKGGGQYIQFSTSQGLQDETLVECDCGNHVEFTTTGFGYGTNALYCALRSLKRRIPDIQALRKPQPQKATMRTIDKSDRDQIAQNVKTINQNLRANLDPEAIIAAYEQTDPAIRVGIVITVPADFKQPATFEVKSGSGVLPSGVLPLSDRLILTTLNAAPTQNLACLANWSMHGALCIEWLETNHLKATLRELIRRIKESGQG